jgi:hypothetical protein
MAKRSLLDRSVVTILKDPDPTPSVKDGILASTERLHRLHGTSLIASSCRLLKLSASTFATACSIFHRFFHQVSLKKANVWSIAMACTLLAAKIEEAQLTIRHIILVYTHLYRRRRLVLLPTASNVTGTDEEYKDECKSTTIVQHPGVGVDPLSTSLTGEAKVLHLRNDLPGLSTLGPIWKDWYDEIVSTENIILRQLGFTLYFIPDQHSHKFILYFLRVLKVEYHLAKADYEAFVQRAWNYCSDCSRLDLCVRFDSEVLACTAIFLTALDCGVELPLEPVPWWQVFCGPDKRSEISTAANAVLGLVEATAITAVASKAFVVSLMPEGSFNDPGSFLWESAVVAKPSPGPPTSESLE